MICAGIFNFAEHLFYTFPLMLLLFTGNCTTNFMFLLNIVIGFFINLSSHLRNWHILRFLLENFFSLTIGCKKESLFDSVFPVYKMLRKKCPYSGLFWSLLTGWEGNTDIRHICETSLVESYVIAGNILRYCPLL